MTTTGDLPEQAGTGQAPRRPGHEDRIARAALTRLLEPGDVLGLAAVGTWGAARALEVLTGRDGAGADERQELALVLEAAGTPLSSRGWQRGTERWAARAGALAPERDLETLHRLGGGLLVPGDPGWPTALRDLGPASPVALWYRGGGGMPERHVTLAVVGSRDASPYGRGATRLLAGGVGARGITVLSGGAYGIDALAHQSALGAGTGSPPTAAVLAGGLDRYYPAGNATLLQDVADQGLLLSELAPGSSPTRYRFLQRNRLIAALAGAVLVVEARWRSGAQNTAGHALALGREVGVVPGPITSSTSAGCHRLLRESPAVPVTDVAEALELLPGRGDRPCGGDAAPPAGGTAASRDTAVRPHDHLAVEELLVYEALPLRSAAPVDRLCAVAGLGPGTVMGVLQKLRRQGLAEQSASGWRRRSPASGADGGRVGP
ncbi:DNA-processing protein DprA [Citricoccus sp. SGAir0253]|uniref:DNA-processing protein DprA n=1 Tax=Citricoccus sp. SGAir0253 TaxID=2567881 RepID=UPI0010CD49F3|nr:DNA-processing protein DprA [Citricoccus sp. SGAir0253]QCU78333.1 DNA-processing protein DprA [Citricoccus sp. SGAir0253]